MQYATRPFLLAVLAWLIFALSPGVLLTAPPEVDGIDRAALRKIEPRLLKELPAAREGRIRFIVQFDGRPDLSALRQEEDRPARRQAVVKALRSTAERTQRPALAQLERARRQGKVESYRSLWIINGAAVAGDRETLFALAARPEVVAIRLDRVRYLGLPPEPVAEPLPAEEGGEPAVSSQAPLGVEWNLSKIRADAVWSALNITGTGAVIASLDTGVDWQHPALVEKYRGSLGQGVVDHAGNWRDFTTDASPYPVDGHGHGTHVTGIMVGSDGANQVGVAPGARWIAAKVFLRDGSAQDSWIHDAFQWVLQPEGDPDLAPDIVNASWGGPDAADQTFHPDVEALLAAGIVPVFAAGNSGPNSGTINSPASLNVAFGVGATDSADNIADFSSRGPSPWGKVKPEVSAPGAVIRSAYPGGSYAYLRGTSMATPHVSGLLALIKQASPGMTPLQALGVITSTAAPRGTDRPNNSYGWGRVDAYAAVSEALQAGTLGGTVDGAGGTPIAGAIVTATNQTTGSRATATTRQNGSYALALAPGFYDVNAGAFGYAESAPVRVSIDPGRTVTGSFTLAALPVGFVAGVVVDEGTGRPLTATISLLDTPLSVQTGAGAGAFTLTAPVGTYGVRAASAGHRLRTQTGVTVAVSATTNLTFTLPGAPSILVVDSGAWYAESQVGYFTAALDRLDYLYAVRPITDTRLVPTLAELAPYDVVVWSSPFDSPGYVGADTALVGYLDRGGRLLLSGQDIGYLDGGGSGLIVAPYYNTHLRARFISDDAGTSNLSGVADSVFAGITLTLNTVDSAQNQLFPDIVAPDGLRSSQIVEYERDGAGGIETGICLPYRLIYLSFGLEGAGPAANRVALLERAIDWLVSRPPGREVRALPAAQSRVQESGKVATATLTIWNTGTVTDAFDLSLSGPPDAGWPVSLWDGSFSRPVTTTGDIPSCQAITVGVRTEVPPGLGRNVSNSATLLVEGPGSPPAPSPRQTATVTVKTPAALLLVDDDRWYDIESRYKNTLFDLGYPYDVISTGGGPGPDVATLGLYSITVWFTGYDWHQPLTAQDEANLAAFLDRGGRLFLSSQDYLYVRGLNDFGVNYLGVLTYTNDITAVQVSGVGGNIVGAGLGPFTLSLPFEGYKEWSDELVPRPPSSASFLNVLGAPAGLTNLDGSGRGRTVFFAFPFEGLAPEPARLVMDRIIERALGTDMKASKGRVVVGDEVRYELSVFNPGVLTATWSITNPLPAFTAIVPGSLEGGATFDEGANRILWQGLVGPGDTRQITYRLRVLAGAGGAIGNAAFFERAGKRTFTRTVTTPVRYTLHLLLIHANYPSAW